MTELARIVEATPTPRPLGTAALHRRAHPGRQSRTSLPTRRPLLPICDDQSIFEQVRVNPESGTVEWPGDIDLDPDVLYGTHEAAHGEPLERRVIETAR